RVVRARERQFFPTRSLTTRIDDLARDVGASVILLDPWLPLGQLGPRLTAAPYVVVVHGAEVTVPGRLRGHGNSAVACCGARRASWPRARTPHARRSGSRDRSSEESSCRRASTPT